jgi:plastocyanin
MEVRFSPRQASLQVETPSERIPLVLRRRLVIIGAAVGALAIAGGTLVFSIAAGTPRTARSVGPTATGGSSGAAGGGGYGGMMGGGYNGMMGGGYGSPNPSTQPPAHGFQTVTLRVRADDEHGRRGPDGVWHDAFLPADFTVRPGETTRVTVYNYDTAPHSFTSASLRVDETIPAGSSGTPSKATFTFTAPSRSGRYQWWCALPCDPFAMAHDGFMRGHVTVTG